MKKIFKKLCCFFTGKYQIAILDLHKGRWIVEPKDDCIGYFKAENAKGRHILIKPLKEIESFFLLADDLSCHLIELHHKQPDNRWKPGRMVFETSPDNFQVWIHSSRALEITEKRYWLKKMHSDPGADPKHRWGRCPGFRNRKEKYRDAHGGYPLAKLIWVDWQKYAHIPIKNAASSVNSPFFFPSTRRERVS